MSKHTSGPWIVVLGSVRHQYDTVERVVAANGRRVMQGNHPFRADEEQLANARLIAAAPELLEAVWGLLRLAQSRVSGDPAITKALAAIEKAEGRS